MQVTENFNLWDFISLVRSKDFQQRAAPKYSGSTVLNPDYSFVGFSNLDEIERILNKEVTKNGDFLQNNRTFDMVPDVCGSVVNMDAFIQGQPEDMYNFVSSESNIVQDLNLYYAINGAVPVQHISDAAKRVKEYIESKPANVSFNIKVRSDYKMYGGRDKKSYSLNLLVASAEDYLTDQVVNLLGHPMFFRYFMLHHRFEKLNSNTQGEPTPPDYINFLTFNKTW